VLTAPARCTYVSGAIKPLTALRTFTEDHIDPIREPDDIKGCSRSGRSMQKVGVNITHGISPQTQGHTNMRGSLRGPFHHFRFNNPLLAAWKRLFQRKTLDTAAAERRGGHSTKS
jgi:hypothetical protein